MITSFVVLDFGLHFLIHLNFVMLQVTIVMTSMKQGTHYTMPPAKPVHPVLHTLFIHGPPRCRGQGTFVLCWNHGDSQKGPLRDHQYLCVTVDPGFSLNCALFGFHHTTHVTIAKWTDITFNFCSLFPRWCMHLWISKRLLIRCSHLQPCHNLGMNLHPHTLPIASLTDIYHHQRYCIVAFLPVQYDIVTAQNRITLITTSSSAGMPRPYMPR